MENINSLWPKKYNRYILLSSFLTMVINYFYFGENSVSAWFLISHLLTIILFLFFITRFNEKSKEYSIKKFEKKVFRIGLLLNTICILFFYVFFYILTNTEFDAAAVDAKWYHDNGVIISQQLSEFRFDKTEIAEKIDFDDLGYNIFLGIIYFIFGPNVIIARIIQALFGSFSAIIIYRIGKSLYTENVGRTASVFFLFFPLFVYFNALHLKETIMLFLTLLSINSIINFQNSKNKIKYILFFLLTIYITFSFRTVLTFILLATFLFSLLFENKISFDKKISFTIFSGLLLLVIVWQIGLIDEISNKMFKYVDSNVESSVMTNKAEQIANNGQTFAKYASGPVIFIQSISFPYPSMGKTNIGDFNQAAQWYHISGLFIWAYLSYWAILGMYDSMKENLRKNLPLLGFTIFYSIILVITLYITTVRFNILKIAPMLIFVAVGLNNNSLKRQWFWYFYIVWISIVILVWNYVKIAGRGLI